MLRTPIYIYLAYFLALDFQDRDSGVKHKTFVEICCEKATHLHPELSSGGQKPFVCYVEICLRSDGSTSFDRQNLSNSLKPAVDRQQRKFSKQSVVRQQLSAYRPLNHFCLSSDVFA